MGRGQVACGDCGEVFQTASSDNEEPGPPLVGFSGAQGSAAASAGAGVVRVNVLVSMSLFGLAAVAEIGGAWLVWQGMREHKGLLSIGAGVVALGLYGFIAMLVPDSNFGRILAAYGGVFVGGSLAWGMAVNGFSLDR